MRRCAILATVAVLLPALGAAQDTGERQPAVVRHTLEWRENCLMCHRPGALDAVPEIPESHTRRSVRTCLWCHAGDVAMQTVEPGEVPHEIEQRTRCLLCHTPGRIAAAPDVPGDHRDREDAECTLCHRLQGERLPRSDH